MRSQPSFEDEVRAMLRRRAADVDRRASSVQVAPYTARRGGSRRPAYALAGAAALALCVVALTAAIVTSGRASLSGPAASTTSSTLDYVLDAPGWNTTAVSSSDEHHVEMSFQRGDLTAELLAPYVSGVEYQVRLGTTDVVGHPAEIWSHGGQHPKPTSGNHLPLRAFAVKWRQGRQLVAVEGNFRTEAEVRQLVAGLRVVDERSWVRALPTGTIAHADQPSVLRQLSAGIPLPPSVSAAEISSPHGRSATRPDLAADVLSRVACGWVRSWVDGTTSGDAAAVERATAAMGTASSWPPMADVSPGMVGIVLQFARAMAVNGRVGMGAELPIADTYRDAFGCDHLRSG